jgi:hypothetical protein
MNEYIISSAIAQQQNRRSIIGQAIAGANLPQGLPQQVELHREIEMLGKALDYLEDRVAEINTRLHPLMLPEPPSQDASGDLPEAMAGSPIGQSLQNMRARVDHAAGRLSLSIGRLAV